MRDALISRLLCSGFALAVVAMICACIHTLRSTAIPVYIQDTIGYKRSGLLPLLTIREHQHPVNYTVATEIQPKDLCTVTLILTFAPHALARKTIRETWTSTTDYRGRRLRRLFVFGHNDDSNFNDQAKAEGKLYNDVLQVAVPEGYRSLTNKTVAALQWLKEKCSTKLLYILKTDDDSFNVPEAYVDYLININETEPFIGGYCFTVLPDRRQSSKYYTSTKAYPSDNYYPTYCAGPAYVLSMSSLKGLLEMSKRARYLSMEDVFITGICRELAGYRYKQIHGAVVGREEFTSCKMKRGVAKSLHRVIPESATLLWKRYKQLSPCLKHDSS